MTLNTPRNIRPKWLSYETWSESFFCVEMIDVNFERSSEVIQRRVWMTDRTAQESMQRPLDVSLFIAFPHEITAQLAS